MAVLLVLILSAIAVYSMAIDVCIAAHEARSWKWSVDGWMAVHASSD
jgi:hypothetical protein